jgi:enoyl-[acyl-carrier protein] reductase II
MSQRIHQLFGTRYPILQGGMAWVSEAPLVSAVSAAGGLGILGAGTMAPSELEKNIAQVRAHTQKPFAVNIPLVNVRPGSSGDAAAESVEVALAEGVSIVFTSAGSPRRFTPQLKSAGCLVIHVVPSLRHALKAAAAGVDAIVVECSRAGGHVSPEGEDLEILLGEVLAQVDIPVIAAGGIADAGGVRQALAWGAQGVQVGTRFIATLECNAHPAFKKAIVDAHADATAIYCREFHPSRALKTSAVKRLLQMEAEGIPLPEILAFRGRGRAEVGCVQGNLEEGILPCGTGTAHITEILPVAKVMEELAFGLS